MRKGIFLFVLMISLLPLSGCFQRDEEQSALDLAFEIRKELLAAEHFSAQADIRADYGIRVYDYTLDARKDEKGISFTVLSPDIISGISAHCKDGETFLEYDGLCIETGPLDDQGLTPLSAVPALWEAAKAGYIESCELYKDGILFVHIADPNTPTGTGTESFLWFDSSERIPLRGEITVDGFRCIECIFSSFTKE